MSSYHKKCYPKAGVFMYVIGGIIVFLMIVWVSLSWWMYKKYKVPKRVRAEDSSGLESAQEIKESEPVDRNEF